jgi:hypothetical protein
MSVFTARRLRAGLALGLSVVVAGAGATAASAAPADRDVQRALVERTAAGPAGADVQASGKIAKVAKRHAKAIKRAKKHPNRTRAAVGPNASYNLGCVYTSTILICGNDWSAYYPGWVHVEYLIDGQDGAAWISTTDWNAIVAYLQNA